MKFTHLFLFLVFSIFSHTYALNLKETLLLPPQPLELKATLNKNVVKKLITASQGGQISLKNQAGQEFSIFFPPDSVPYDSVITLTEIETLNINDQPKIFSFNGVQIQPDGLILKKPAILEIKFQNELNITHLTTLSSDNQGADVHSAQLKNLSSDKISLNLFHFSNYITTTDAEVEAILENSQSTIRSTRTWNWYNQKMNRLLKSNADSSQISQEIIHNLKEIMNDLVIPQLSNLNSCQAGQQALNDYLQVVKTAALVGIDMKDIIGLGLTESFRDAMILTNSKCLQEARHFCHDKRDFKPAIDIWLSLHRNAALLGMTDLTDAIDLASRKCMTFQFFMNVDFWMGEERKESHGLTVMSDFQLQFNLTSVLATAVGQVDVATGVAQPLYDFHKGPIGYVDAYMRNDPMICNRVSLNNFIGYVSVDNFIGDLYAGRKMTLRVGEFHPTGSSTFNCFDPNDREDQFTIELPPYGESDYASGLYETIHGPLGLNERVMLKDKKEIAPYELRQVQFYPGQNRIAEGSYNASTDNIVHETSTITIHHTPID